MMMRSNAFGYRLARSLAGLLATVGMPLTASASPITITDYALTEITGNWVWGDYDLNREVCCGVLGAVDNGTNLGIVDGMMRDGLPAEAANSGQGGEIGDGNGPGGSTGIYRHDPLGTPFAVTELVFSMNGGSDFLISGLTLWTSRTSPLTVEAFTRIDGGIWVSRLLTTSAALGFGFNAVTADPHDIVFSAVMADEIKIAFVGSSSNQVGINDALVLGTVPEPLTAPLLALGLVGLAVRRRAARGGRLAS